MSEKMEKLKSLLEKSRSEFDIACTCMTQALQSLHERMDRIEKWIWENTKKDQP